MNRHTLSIIVEDRPGVLTRVSTMFRRRGYNIESLSVGATEDPKLSRITIVVPGDDTVIEQVLKQLHKLVDVRKIVDITAEDHVERELVLIKVQADSNVRADIVQLVEIFRARIVDIGKDSLIIEATGDEGKISAIQDSLKTFGIIELVRTGKIAVTRGQK